MGTNTVNPEGVHRRLQELVNGGHSLVNVLPQMLQTAIEHQVWKTLAGPDGKPFGSLAAYLLAHYPFGAGCESHRNALTYAQLMELCADFPKVKDVLAREAPKGRPGRKKAGEANGISTNPIMPRGKANSQTVPVLSARLAQEHPDIWAAYLSGSHETVTAAAIAAGLITNSNAPLKRLKENWRKAGKGERKEFLAFLRDEGAI